jgi:hypothetical protein
MELSKDELLGDWYRRIRYAQFAHYESASALIAWPKKRPRFPTGSGPSATG